MRRYFSLTCPICGRTETFVTPSPDIAHLSCGPHFLNGRETMISVDPDARIFKVENPVFEEVTTA